MPKIINSVGDLTKEEIGSLYFLSIGNKETRKMHAGLLGARSGPTPVAPSTHDMEIDFTCWYGGILSLANALDPGVSLPPTQVMLGYITQNFEKVTTAIAA